MEFLDESHFTEEQSWIIHLRVIEKMTYRQIQAAWKIAHLNEEDEYLSSRAIKTCFRRSSLALKWKKGQIYGNDFYLSKPDIDILKQYISDRCENDDPSDAKDLLEEALLIRKQRQFKAVNFLRKIDCQNIADELENDELDQPVRSWINANLSELDAKIRASRIVDGDRYFSCCPEIIEPFFNLLEKCLDGVQPPLIFGADELGLDPTIKKKFIIPDSISEFLVPDAIAQIPHITVMFTHNIIGEHIPPFVIFPNLEKCPKEIINKVNFGQIWCCSTQSGWQNRNSFLLWTINFINWLSSYRKTLDQSIRDSKAVLIIDGHTSRENPKAIYILNMNNVEILVLPAHTTHLLQMFDVVLAKPFKKRFSEKFNKIFSKLDFTKYNSIASAIRETAVNCLIDAWSEVCTSSNCQKAAEVTGTFPQNRETVLSNVFVHSLTEEEKQAQQKKRKSSRLNINGKILNDQSTFDEINSTIYQKESFRHLSVVSPFDYCEFCCEMATHEFDDAILFSKFHHFSTSDGKQVFF